MASSMLKFNKPFIEMKEEKENQYMVIELGTNYKFPKLAFEVAITRIIHSKNKVNLIVAVVKLTSNENTIQ